MAMHAIKEVRSQDMVAISSARGRVHSRQAIMTTAHRLHNHFGRMRVRSPGFSRNDLPQDGTIAKGSLPHPSLRLHPVFIYNQQCITFPLAVAGDGWLRMKQKK